MSPAETGGLMNKVNIDLETEGYFLIYSLSFTFDELLPNPEKHDLYVDHK